MQAKKKELLESGGFCIILLLILSLVGGMSGISVSEPNRLFQWLFVCAILICGMCAVYWKLSGQLTEGRLIALLFLLALAARLCYTLSIPITRNQHDTSTFDKGEGNNGHTGYILYLLENGKLPGEEVWNWQFYHPPLHHLVCAIWLKLQTAVHISFETAAENLQILTTFYSMVSLYASYRVMRLLNLRGTALIAPFCLLAFHPTFFLLSGSINNDCMSVMFCLLAVWAVLEWYKNPTFPRIIGLAFCIGCAMMAKLAAGLIAPAVAALFLYKLCRTKGWGIEGKGRLILQFAAFGAICIPLGIGWQVRNYLLYDMPLTYVPALSATNKQYLGGYSIWERFFDFKSLSDFGVYPMRTGRQDAAYYEHCIPLAIQKMSLFGEYSTWKDKATFDALAKLLFGVNIAVVAASLAGMGTRAVRTLQAYFGKKASRLRREAVRKENGFGTMILLFLLLYWGTMVLSYVQFCFSFPHFCSMDFRYIVPTLLIGAIFFGMALRRLEERRGKGAVFLRAALLCCTAAFCVCSVALYPLYF